MMFASFNSKTPDVTCGTGSANPFGTPQYTPIVSGFILLDLCFLCMFCRSLSVLFLFILAIVLFFFPRFTASDYLFGIFKLYL